MLNIKFAEAEKDDYYFFDDFEYTIKVFLLQVRGGY